MVITACPNAHLNGLFSTVKQLNIPFVPVDSWFKRCNFEASERFMRVIKEIVHPDYRTTIFHWNNKYIIKLETSAMEQTYKIDQFELASDEEAIQLLDSTFIQQVMARFGQMAVDMASAMARMQS
jgi:hypothetical protein